MLRRCLLIVALVAYTAVARAQAPISLLPVPGTSHGVTAFVDVNVIPMDTERLLPSQTVLVEGDHITALGSASQVKVPKGAMRIDGHGKFLIPGLADMHVHFSELGLLGSNNAANQARALFTYLAYGVTTIRNMDHLTGLRLSDDPALQLKAQAAAGTLLSPRIYTGGQWGPDHYTNRNEIRKDQPGALQPRLDSVAAYVAAYKAAGYDFLKPYQERRPLFDSLLVVTRRLGVPMAGHIPQLDTTIMLGQVLASGAYTSIEHLLGYSRALLRLQPTTPRPVGREPPWMKPVRLEDFDPKILAWERAQLDTTKLPALAAATKRAGVWNCPTLAIYENRTIGVNGIEMPGRTFDGPVGSGTGFTFTPAILDVYRQIAKALQTAGAGLLLGTDAFPTFTTGTGMNGFATAQELEALVRATLTPYQALATGTRNVAQYFGTLESTGTVAVGKRADLVLLGGNPLRDVGVTREPVGVMLGGRWLDRGELDQGLTASAATVGNALLDKWLVSTVSVALRLNTRLTAAQGKSLRELRTVQETALKALTDSLDAGTWAPGGAARSRVLARVAEQLGEWRAVLTPVQQGVFDPFGRIWMRVQAQQGVRVTIPGLIPLGRD